ncbi:hypothetical protein GCM10009573_28550 [Agromyces bracchium]
MYRWLGRGDWTDAALHSLEVSRGSLVLAGPETLPSRRGIALLDAGRPLPQERESTTDDRWRDVRILLAEPLPDGAWVRLWTRVEQPPAQGPAAAVTAPTPADSLFDDSAPATPRGLWRPAAVDALGARVFCREDGFLWVAVELGSTGEGSASVAELLVLTGDDGPVTRLPIVYRTTPEDRALDRAAEVDSGDGLLGRYLGLVASQLRHTSSLLDELPVQLSPLVAPDRDDAPWIDRLARWVALDPDQLPPRTDTSGRRERVTHAVARHARRGTADGIRDEIARRTGIPSERIELEEPLLSAEIWRLDANPLTSALGLTTGLVAADPGPPALDANAYLDRSALIDPRDAGLPVHATTAHRLCVHIVDGTPDEIAAADVVVQSERPAHVWARTCAVAHETGADAVVGVDAIPAEGPPGLFDDAVQDPDVDGPGIRIGTARLPRTEDSPHHRPAPVPTREGEAS